MPAQMANLVPLAGALLLVPRAAAQSSSGASGASTSTVISALVLNLVIFAIEIVVFILLRPRFRKVYSPKTYLGPQDERAPPQPTSLFGWISPWLNTNKFTILHKQGLDAFMYLEYLELMIMAFVPIFVVSWVVLLPVYSTGITMGKTGFEMFTFGNVGSDQYTQRRYVATLLVQWAATLWLLFLIRKKVGEFVKLRQEFIVSEKHATSAQAKTLLVTGVPNNMLSEKKLKALYSHLPGGVERVWLHRNLKDLPDLFAQRLKWCDKLEAAEASLVKIATKKVKKGKVEGEDVSIGGGDVPLNVAEKYVTQKERPTHKIGSKLLCFGGEKVDTIEWCREEIQRLNKEIAHERSVVTTDFEKYPPQNSAFLLFNQQVAAHMASKTTAHHLPYRMNERFIEAHPNNVVWSNLNMNPYEKKIRSLTFWAITLAIVLFWCVPVGFIGIVSNVKGLSENVGFLSWLGKIPNVVVGIIQSILPTVLLAVLNMLLPIFLRLFSQLSGAPTRTAIELSLMDRFFLFQIIQNFLFLTIVSGGAAGVAGFVSSIATNPSAFPGRIAAAIPSGSTFFLSYILLQGLTGVGGGFMQAVPLVVYYVKKFLLGSTPRKMWHVENDMPAVAWGTLFPMTSLITVIAIGYMVIAPIVAGFTMVTFVLYWLLYKYNFIYVYDQKPETETSGLFFPKAIGQIFAGLYLEMVMVAALFFLANAPVDPANPDGETMQTAIPEGAFMVILIIIVAAFHYFLNDSYGPLYQSLPLDTIPADSEAHSPARTAISDGAAQPQLGGGSDIEKQVSGNAASSILPSEIKQRNAANTSADDDMASAFDQPAIKEDQRPLWFPNDRFGLGSAAVANARKHELAATNEGTSYNEKGAITVSAAEAPGERLD